MQVENMRTQSMQSKQTESLGISVFKITSVQQVAPGVVQLEWLSETNRIYAVYTTTNLGAGTNAPVFTPIATNLFGTLATNALLLANIPSGNQFFYRIQVTLP